MNGFLPPLLCIELDLYPNEITILITVFPLYIVCMSYTDHKLKLRVNYPPNLISSHVNDFFLWPLPLGACSSEVRGTAASLGADHRSITWAAIICRVSGIVLSEQGRGRQTDRQTALQLWPVEPCNRMTHWKALAFPAPGSLVTSSVGHSYVT